MTRTRILQTTLALTACAIALISISCTEQQSETAAVERLVAVKAMVTQPSDRQVIRTYTGSLQGEQQAVLRARLAEAVETVHVTEGQSVKTDDILITLDKYGPSSQYVQTQSQYQNSKKNFEKMEYLFGEGAASESQFDAARTQYEVAQAQFEAVSRMIDIRTPIAGQVTSINVSPGDLVRQGQELATIATTDRLRAKFGVNADDVRFFKAGAEVVVIGETSETSASGKVATVASSADPTSRSFQVEAIIDNSAGQFSPGMFVHIDYILERLPGVIAVPREAIINFDGQETVFAAVAGRAQMRRVTLGADLSGDVVILSGLNAGDTLVTLGQDYLEDSLKLNITELEE
jgi:membrane fusion protein (multidrug efflux system)